MWMVCDTCGKKVCNDLNLYRHRNDTSKLQCKKCIKCDVPITSRREIRTHMKLNHKDIPCDVCKKKFYLAAACDQHKQDVHKIPAFQPKAHDQTKRDIENSPTTKAHDQTKRDIENSPTTKAHDQTKRDIENSPTTKVHDQPRPAIDNGPTTNVHDQPKRNVHSNPTIPPKVYYQPNRNMHCNRTISPKVNDHPNPDVYVNPIGTTRERSSPRLDVYSSPTTSPREHENRKRDLNGGPTTSPREYDHRKRDLNGGPTTSPREYDHRKRDLNGGPTDSPRGRYQPKHDVSIGRTAVDNQPNRELYHLKSSQPILPKEDKHIQVKSTPDRTQSLSNETFKQPKENTRFLTSLQLNGNNLKRLHDKNVRQDADKMRRCKEIVHHLVTFMQHHLGCGVSEVVKGGSLGKGTSIKEKVDIDLVVYMKSIKSVAELQERRKEIIKELKKHILKDFTFAKQLHYSYDTEHSNRFSLRTDDGTELIQVDLLPACDIGGGSEKVFDVMACKDKEARSFYSVSFAKDQVRFTKEKPETVKDAIRLIKHWKTLEKLKIPSYTVEIMTIKEWERMGSPPQVDLNELFKWTMMQFCDMNTINITWPNARDEKTRSSVQPRGPIVMDPTNPFNNTASKIKQSHQEVIERKAREVVDHFN